METTFPGIRRILNVGCNGVMTSGDIFGSHCSEVPDISISKCRGSFSSRNADQLQFVSTKHSTKCNLYEDCYEYCVIQVRCMWAWNCLLGCAALWWPFTESHRMVFEVFLLRLNSSEQRICIPVSNFCLCALRAEVDDWSDAKCPKLQSESWILGRHLGSSSSYLWRWEYSVIALSKVAVDLSYSVIFCALKILVVLHTVTIDSLQYYCAKPCSISVIELQVKFADDVNKICTHAIN